MGGREWLHPRRGHPRSGRNRPLYITSKAHYRQSTQSRIHCRREARNGSHGQGAQRRDRQREGFPEKATHQYARRLQETVTSNRTPRKPVKMQIMENFPADTPGVLRPLFSDRPVLTGTGEDSYVCGSCANVLMQGVTGTRAREFAIRCGKCGSYNEVLSSER